MKGFEETDHDHAFSADTRGFMVAVRRRGGFGVVEVYDPRQSRFEMLWLF